MISSESSTPDLVSVLPELEVPRPAHRPPGFPTLSAAESRRERTFAILRNPEAAGPAWTLAPTPPLRAAATASSWRALSTPSDVALLLAPEAIALLIARHFPEADPAALAPGLEAVLAEAALAPVLARLETILAAPLAITEIGPPAAARRFDAALALETEHGLGISVLLQLGGPARQRFEAWATGLERRRARRPDIPLAVSFRLGSATLPVSRARTLRTGDGIVVGHADKSGSACAVVIGERLAQRAEILPEGFRLAGPLLPIDQTAFRSLSHETTMSEPETPPSEDNLRDMPVRIVFELGRIELPLGEIETIAEGHVFEIGRRTDEAVDIVIGGRTIGRGDIVMVGDALAVRIIRLDR